ncbi:hypothetical protein T440DRAFT_474094 [Plenodomus tracheiphilus IPT5]|uniref:Uncharacterized protein n=1 Tax=Plenodomus tracheiphilus IPT5 TaxID=1408161 RepID=A0A6A7BMQ3_9PLEO|nr:hypothetical protein T440DRAFT_474094 [Plenodomus tracheiphilus IPT5]
MVSSSDPDEYDRSKFATGGTSHNILGLGCNEDAYKDSNEARGSRAYARIHTEHHNATVPRPILKAQLSGSELGSSPLQLGGQRKGPRRSRLPVSYANTSQPLNGSGLFEPYPQQHDGNAGHDDDHAIRRAIELSLADQAAAASPGRPSTPVDELDVQDDLIIVKSRSLFTTANTTASTSATPYAPLANIIDSMNATAEDLENRAGQNTSGNLWELTGLVREWEETITRVKHRMDAAEHGRHEDLQMHIKFDAETSEAHRRQINRMKWTLREKLRDMKTEWERKLEQQKEEYEITLKNQIEVYKKQLEEQKQVYEKEIALQTVEAGDAEPSKGHRGRTRSRALSPSPTITMRPRTDITVPSKHTNDHREYEADQTPTKILGQRKSNYVTLSITTLPETTSGKADDQNSEAWGSEISQASNAHSYQHKNNTERRAPPDLQSRQGQHKRDRPVGNDGIETSNCTSRSPEKRKRNEENRSWSPKKTKSK